MAWGAPDPWQANIPKPPKPRWVAPDPWMSLVEGNQPKLPTSVAPDNWQVALGLAPTEAGTFNTKPGQQEGANENPAAAPYDPTIDYLMGQKTNDMARRRNARNETVKRRLLAFGSRELARKFFGDNDPFTQMVSDDPASSTSYLAEAKRRLSQTLSNTNSLLGNQYGLWNSSGRTEELGNQTRDYTTDVSKQTSALEDEFAGLDQGLSQAEAEWMQRIFDARRAAWQAGASNHGF
jgi:hypothetical protein